MALISGAPTGPNSMLVWTTEFRSIWNYTARCQSTRELKRLSGAILESVAATTNKSRQSPITAEIPNDTPQESAEEAVANHQ